MHARNGNDYIEIYKHEIQIREKNALTVTVLQAAKRKRDEVAQKVAAELLSLQAKRQRLKASFKELAKPTNKEKKKLLAEVALVTGRESQLAAELEKGPCPYCRVSLSDARARCYIALCTQLPVLSGRVTSQSASSPRRLPSTATPSTWRSWRATGLTCSSRRLSGARRDSGWAKHPLGKHSLAKHSIAKHSLAKQLLAKHLLAKQILHSYDTTTPRRCCCAGPPG
jgi:hypothetical protein